MYRIRYVLKFKIKDKINSAVENELEIDENYIHALNNKASILSELEKPEEALGHILV